MFHHSLYARLLMLNEDDYNHQDDDTVLFYREATVQWDLQSYYSDKYHHAPWCC